MIYRIDSKQTISKGLDVHGVYGNCQLSIEMCEFIGKKVTISSHDAKQNQYKIKDDGCKYFWHESMFK